MTTLPIPGGLLNKDIVDQAYTVLGLSDSMFGRTDEEYATGMSMLRAMMEEYPYDRLGFDAGDARIGGESGIASKYMTAISHGLAVRIGSALNKTLKPGPQAVFNRAFSRLSLEVASITEVGHALGTPVGAGHRTWNRRNFFADGE